MRGSRARRIARMVKMKLAGLTLAVIVGIIYHVPPTLLPPEGTPTWLFFDGVCNLCDGFVNFVADGDSARNVRFGAIQKHTELLEQRGAPTDLSTVVLVQGDHFYTQSTAALRTLAQMDQPWRSLSALHVIPPAVRDFAYGVIARNRYRMFGKQATCRKPSGAFKSRFLEHESEAVTPSFAAEAGAGAKTSDEL
eukprot:g2503.t1